MFWYLQILGGPIQLMSAFGVSKLRRRVSSQKESVFTFSVVGTYMDGSAIAAEGSLCSVWYGVAGPEFLFFTGRLYQVPRKGSGSAESIDYEIRDAWLDFGQIVFQQQWNVITGTDEEGNPTTAPEYRSELILGMDLSGDALHNGEQIAEIVQWAINCGAYCQIGDIAVAAPVAFDEVTDTSCAECIKRMLRWSPDAVAWFDYSVTPPAFNVTPRGDCEAVYLGFAGALDAMDIHPLPFLVPPSVVIRYIQVTNSNDGEAIVEVITDDYPSGSDGTAYGGMVMTCRLAEGQSTYQKQKVTAKAFPTDNSAGPEGGPADDPLIQFWQRKVGWLNNLGVDLSGDDPPFQPSDVADQLVITNMWGTFDLGEGDDDGSGGVAVIGDEDYPNELLTGTIASWMSQTVAKTTWTALVKYSYPDSQSDYSEQDWDAVAAFGPDDGSGYSAPCLVQAKATATNASSQTYSSLTGYEAPEDAPSGLAEYLYASLAELQYEGTYKVTSQEVSSWRLGLLLNIAGGREEWGTMNALLQEIEDDLDDGSTTLRFGPPGHLTLQDLMELLRANRTRTNSTHIKERETGSSGDISPVDGDTQGSSDGPSQAPSLPCPPWIASAYEQGDASDTLNNVTFVGLIGYGLSSLVSDDFNDNHPPPLENMEISVGNDGSDWPAPSGDGGYAGNTLAHGFSLITGDDTADNDQLLIGRMDGAGDDGEGSGGGGSIILTPYDDATGDAPSIVLSPNLQGQIDSTDDSGRDAYIRLSLSGPLIDIYNGADAFIRLDMSNLEIQVNDGSDNSIVLEINDGDPSVTVTAQNYSTSIGGNTINMSNTDETNDSTYISLGKIILNQGGTSGVYSAGSLVLGDGTDSIINLDTGVIGTATLSPIQVTIPTAFDPTTGEVSDSQTYWIIGAVVM